MITLTDENYHQYLRVTILRVLDERPGGLVIEDITERFFLEFGSDANVEYLRTWLEFMLAHRVLRMNPVSRKIYRYRETDQLDKFVQTITVKGDYL